jgi:hypothetical protein
MIGVIATVTFRIPYPVLVFAGILLLTVPPPNRPVHQAVGVTGGAFLGAAFAILLAVTTYDQLWIYLPLQCVALTALLVLSRSPLRGRPSSWPRWSCPSPSPPTYLPHPEAAIRAALFNGLALAGTAWVVAAARAPLARPATSEKAPAPPGRGELVGFAMLALSVIDRPADAVLQHDQPARNPHGGNHGPAHRRSGSEGRLAGDALAPALRSTLRCARLSDDRICAA